MRPLVTLGVALAVSASLGAQDPALHLVKPCPHGTHTIKTIAGCTLQGCGGVADAGLNEAKNRTDAAESTAPILTVPDMQLIYEPTDWATGIDRDEIASAEGTAARLIGYLKVVKPEGGETCNCGLKGPVNTDVHLAIVDKKNDNESDSVTAEITPRVRRESHPDWTFGNVKKLEGKFVRLSGWLMLDTAHVPHSHLLPGEPHLGPVNRSTNWEVHPVTRFEVCGSTIANCRMGIGWKNAAFH